MKIKKIYNKQIMAIHSKYFALLAILTLGAVCFTACEDEDNEDLMGNWVNLYTYFPGSPRGGAVCFVIDNKAYVGLGANTRNTEDRERFLDFFYATPNTGGDGNGTLKWSAEGDVASMPKVNASGQNTARNGAVAFALNGKGYVGTGYNGRTYLKDFWEYDPEANSWTQIADYPGDTCRYAVSFVIPGKSTNSDGSVSINTPNGKDMAFVGTGEDFLYIPKSHFYSFDGENWKPVCATGQPRSQASAFVAEGYNAEGKLQLYGYLVGGTTGGSASDAFHRYNALTDEWEYRNLLRNATEGDFDDDYTNLASYGHTSFVINSTEYQGQRAYITTGSIKGSAGNYTWEYNPYYDYWIQKTSFEGPARKFAVSFTLQFPDPWHDGQKIDIPFVTTGAVGDMDVTSGGGTFYNDTYFFRPYESKEPRD